MPRIRYGLSPWVDLQARARRPAFPRLTGTIETPLVIVGGGLTGAATAYACAAAGLRAVLIEADRIGSGATSGAAGLIRAEPDAFYLDHEARHGRRVARAVWQGTRRAALDCQASLRRLNVRAGLDPLDGLIVARTPDGERRLRRELQARKDAGLDASAVTRRTLASTGIDGAFGIRTRGHARVDPLRACLGFVRAAVARGIGIFEGTPAERIRHTRSGVDIVVPRGTIRSARVIVATGGPPRDIRALARHFEAYLSHAVLTPPLPAPVRTALPDRDLSIRDLDQPPHHLTWTADQRILFSGADGPRPPDRARPALTVQRTGQLMYELSLAVESISGIQPEYGWDAPYFRTADAAPFIGPHRNYPHHLFAFGLGTNLAHSFLASRVLLRHCTGEADRDDEAFGFARLTVGRRAR